MKQCLLLHSHALSFAFTLGFCILSGLIDFLSGSSSCARDLRRKFSVTQFTLLTACYASVAQLILDAGFCSSLCPC
jgi:hypothetical protein